METFTVKTYCSSCINYTLHSFALVVVMDKIRQPYTEPQSTEDSAVYKTECLSCKKEHTLSTPMSSWEQMKDNVDVPLPIRRHSYLL